MDSPVTEGLRTPPVPASLDVEAIRSQFPALGQEVYGKPLVYLDSAASAHKPQSVIDAEMACYQEIYSNVHRGVHFLSQRATEAYESARQKVQQFIKAPSPEEIVFVSGTTEAINLVASSFGKSRVGEGDEVLITAMEHHSNLVPWQMLCEETGANLVVAPIDDRGALILEELLARMTERTKIVACGHISNALGTINPIREITQAAHERGIPVVVDGAQAAPHMPVDVSALDCDFYVFSAHKMFGPTGIGALYGKREHLETMPPYQGGGEMILSVSFEHTKYAPPPARFEAGTPNIAGAVGFGAAVDFMGTLDPIALAAHEDDLLAYATSQLEAVDVIRLIGTAEKKASVVSFLVDGVHAHDVGTILDREGVAVRVGHHCAQPVMDFFGVAATARASMAVYNTRSDIDRLVEGIHKIHEVFA